MAESVKEKIKELLIRLQEDPVEMAAYHKDHTKYLERQGLPWDVIGTLLSGDSESIRGLMGPGFFPATGVSAMAMKKTKTKKKAKKKIAAKKKAKKKATRKK